MVFNLYCIPLLGVGLSKKQAKRCAAENLLSEMKSQGMNVDPDKSPTSSVSLIACIIMLRNLNTPTVTVR